MQHLAQINIARWAVDPASAEAAEFIDNLDRINGLAEQSPGFIWRLKEEQGGNAIAIPTPWGQGIIANLTVWQNLEALRHFTYKTDHLYFVKKRRAWFQELDSPHFALWWIEADKLPDLVEAKERLDRIEASGPTPEAFTFAKAFDPIGQPAKKRPVRGWAAELRVS
ncbi:MAG: DUF3291 domain-containing protein [Pseudomonadota bacterium]